MGLGWSGRVRELNDEKGAAAVEFAIVMVLLFTILFAIIEFGIAFSKVNVYTGAAREGARYVAVRCAPDASCTSALVAARVTNASVGYPIGPGTPTAYIGGAPSFCTDSTIGQAVTVSWSQDITIDIPFVPGLNPITYSRTVQGVFRCE